MSWFSLVSQRKLVEAVNLNDQYFENVNQIETALGSKLRIRRPKKNKKRCFVLDFEGDVLASQSKALSQEITSVLCIAKSGDEVLVCLTSPGGAAHAYGYAASQLERIKKAGLKLTISVDLLAASGGYMMACVADKIIASPFAIIGSVGVVSEFPNFFNLLKNLGIDYKQYTAGKHKRTVSSFGEITKDKEEKFNEDLIQIFQLFKDHVAFHRPKVDIEEIATGEYWPAVKAIDLGLVDEILSAEEYIVNNFNLMEFIKLKYVGDRKGWLEKISENVSVYLFNKFLLFAQHFFYHTI